jgi:hypothetical protein
MVPKPAVDQPGDSTAAKQQAPGLEHGGLKAELTHIHVRHAGGSALLTQLPAPLSDPGGGLAELRAGGAAVLRLGPPVAGEVLDRERAVPKEASVDLGLPQRSLQARNVGRRQVEALDQEALRLLGAHLGRLLDMWVHELGKQRRIDRILVDGVKLRKDPTQHGPEHVGWQPGDPIGLQQPLGQRRLADPRRAADKVEPMATHPSIIWEEDRRGG